VLVERVSDREVAIGDDRPAHLALPALVVGRLVDDGFLDVVELLAAAVYGALPVAHERVVELPR